MPRSKPLLQGGQQSPAQEKAHGSALPLRQQVFEVQISVTARNLLVEKNCAIHANSGEFGD